MKLLVVTQTVDSSDPVLGFFHTWILELAKKFESIEVICLKEGKHQLPPNVRVHSLGKEHGRAGRFAYVVRFKRLAWKLRHNYDAVFVHMNQEYILIAGPMWRILGKRIYLWRNHYAGSFLTSFAVAFCKNVFCTSTHSYTAKYDRNIIMPVGVDTARFSSSVVGERKPRSILFFSRIAPSKRPDMFIEALGVLKEKGIEFTASIVGSPLSEDEIFYRKLKERISELELDAAVTFRAGVPNTEAPAIFAAHDIFVNTSPSGMLDKTIFEAAASNCLVLASSKDFEMYTNDSVYFTNVRELTEKLETLLSLSDSARNSYREKLHALAEHNSLSRLVGKLTEYIRTK